MSIVAKNWDDALLYANTLVADASEAYESAKIAAAAAYEDYIVVCMDNTGNAYNTYAIERDAVDVAHAVKLSAIRYRITINNAKNSAYIASENSLK